MLPAHFVSVESLPLTPTARSTAAGLRERGGLTETGTAPRTPAEEILAAVWSEVLGVERVGVADNFFDLGGHSLLATRVISQLRSAFQVELGLRELFEEPTVAGLAARVERALRAGARVETPPIAPVERTGYLPLSFAQQRLWFIDQLEPGSYGKAAH